MEKDKGKRESLKKNLSKLKKLQRVNPVSEPQDKSEASVLMELINAHCSTEKGTAGD